MLVTISPEMQALIGKRLKSGAFHTPEEVLLDALLTQDSQAASQNKAMDVDRALHRLGEEAFWRGVQQSYGEIAGSPNDVLVYQQEIADWVKTMRKR
jgi:hypothetical protein